MRISDWSSDVCSSDLATEANAPKPCRNGQAAVNSSKNPSIVLLAEPETSASVLYGLYDVLLSVGAVYTDMVAGIPGQELLEVKNDSADGTGSEERRRGKGWGSTS